MASSESSTDASNGAHICDLPNELIQRILQHLSVSDLCHVASCNRRLRYTTNQDSLWRPLCQSRGWEQYGTTTDLAKIVSYGPSKEAAGASEAGHHSVTFQNDRIVTDDNTAGLTSTCRWKGVYMRAHHLDKNWATNRFHFNTFRLSKKKGQHPHLLHIDGDLLVAHHAVMKDAICVHDIRTRTLQCVIPFVGQMGNILIRDGVIVAYARTKYDDVSRMFLDGMIFAIDARTGQTLQTLKHNQNSAFRPMLFDGEMVIAYMGEGDLDEEPGFYSEARCYEICVWCIKDSKLQHIAAAVDVSSDGFYMFLDYWDKILALREDNFITVWDVRSGRCLHQLECPGERTQVKLGDNVIVGFTAKGEMCVNIWRTDTGELQRVIPLLHLYSHPRVVNNLILLTLKKELPGGYLPVHAYTLCGEMVTDVRRGTGYYWHNNGSRILFREKEELEDRTSEPLEATRKGFLRLLTRKGHRGRTKYIFNWVLFNATPNGLVRLFEVDSTKSIQWIDEIRMVFFDFDKQRLSIHNYW